MYLAMLDLEKKHLFLNLEIYLSKIDGDFSADEQRIIDAHCVEMHIDNNGYEAEISQSDVLRQIDTTLNETEKKIFFLELVGTVLADNVYSSSEKALLDKLATIFGMSEEKVSKAFSIIEEMKALYQECRDFIA